MSKTRSFLISAALVVPFLQGQTANAASGRAINCTIKPLQMVEVAPQINGTVAEVFVKPGDRVEPGDPIVKLDSDLSDIELELAEAKAGLQSDLLAARARRYGLAQKESRLAKARKQNAVSIADYEAAAMDLAIAKSDVEREEERLKLAAIELKRARAVRSKALITSPVAGVVGEDVVDPGESVSAKPVATVFVNAPLRVEAFVPANGLEAFAEKDRFEIVVNDRYAAPVEVALDYIAPAADLASNTVSVYFMLHETGILPGSRCAIPGPKLGLAQSGNKNTMKINN